jgi:hypothetical protein
VAKIVSLSMSQSDAAPLLILRKISTYPVIYFFASVNAPKQMPLVFNMVRQGACYPNSVDASSRKVAENPGILKTFWAYVRSGRAVDDLLQMFDITRLQGEIGGGTSEGPARIDAKLNPVIVPNTNSFGIYSYRYVLCPGSIQANITDSDGNVVAGDNRIKTLIVK